MYIDWNTVYYSYVILSYYIKKLEKERVTETIYY